MASNAFGNIFRITTFGESHGEMVGVVIDGCPSGVPITENEINERLSLRRPGRGAYVSPRREQDLARIVSGVFEGRTTGAPLAILVENKSKDSSKYEPIKNLLRPGHANYTYLEKYGVFDYRGGGRASARETVGRVAAGAVAAKILAVQGITVLAYLCAVGDIYVEESEIKAQVTLKKNILASEIFCPHKKKEQQMKRRLSAVVAAGDSIGGQVRFMMKGLPPGLGDPVYEKFSGRLAQAMFSIPAVRGFEIGTGFAAAAMCGSECNDTFVVNKDGKVRMSSNRCGGVLGGITTGTAVTGKVAFKPTPSIVKGQITIDTEGNERVIKLPEGSHHDPCVAVRGVAVVEAMCALVAVDALLVNGECRKWKK